MHSYHSLPGSPLRGGAAAAAAEAAAAAGGALADEAPGAGSSDSSPRAAAAAATAAATVGISGAPAACWLLSSVEEFVLEVLLPQAWVDLRGW